MCVLLETNCNVFIKFEIALFQNGGIIIQCQSMTMGIENGKEANNLCRNWRNKISTWVFVWIFISNSTRSKKLVYLYWNRVVKCFKWCFSLDAIFLDIYCCVFGHSFYHENLMCVWFYAAIADIELGTKQLFRILNVAYCNIFSEISAVWNCMYANICIV